MLLRKHLTLVLLGIAIFLFAYGSCVNPFRDTDILFNQWYEEGVFKESNSFSLTEHVRAVFSSYTARLNNAFNATSFEQMNAADPRSVFDAVFSRIPYYAIVYPTEMYYYFSVPQRELSGNLRFVDIQKGELSFAYFDTDDVLNSKHITLTEADGVHISALSDDAVTIVYKNKTVRFVLPRQETTPARGFLLLPNEVFVSKVQDESGMRFYLLFNNKTNGFYYIVNPEYAPGEAMMQADGVDSQLLVGNRTKYIYYNDMATSRKVLVGVNSYNIMSNSYYDGPFDQVPPRLEIRDMLYRAYPYTQYMNGLDPHGNFLDFEGERVAIGPYVNYYADDLSEMKEVFASCQPLQAEEDPSVFWSCLTYESKKDFHKTLPDFFRPDGTPIQK